MDAVRVFFENFRIVEIKRMLRASYNSTKKQRTILAVRRLNKYTTNRAMRLSRDGTEMLTQIRLSQPGTHQSNRQFSEPSVNILSALYLRL